LGMAREHRYEVSVTWTGNRGDGTTSFRGYDRDHEVTAPRSGKPVLLGTADPAFRGDPARWNPEDLLVTALSQCHMLWVLYLASVGGVVVTDYVDEAGGTMAEDEATGGGRFTEVVLRPRVTVAAPDMADKLEALHHQAHELCFIANSVNFPVLVVPTTLS
jgi:organic hydroperoxide reductase OsmC/OhrA